MPKFVQGLTVALVVTVGGLAWRLIYLHYATETITHTLNDFSQQQLEIARQQQERLLAGQRARQQQVMAEAEQRRLALQLAPDEQCIGGTVIQVKGSVYTQIAGAGGKPQACAGRQRLDGQQRL
ncbi:hypothetical protein [Dyella terrae]|uniref:hypothetical protein n=1 Tax=Dyella terrae TaxID=522259 RepID=UPI001EFD14F6|nr:hypothetical protein [Dyella terrae]ULU25441.1 hypothetical protein DYST_02368 [Dyella terrae]